MLIKMYMFKTKLMRVEMGKEDSGPGCWTLAKDFFTFLLCPETLSDAKFKDNQVIILAERRLQGTSAFRLWCGH